MMVASAVLIATSSFPGSIVQMAEIRYAQIFETPTIIVVERRQPSQKKQQSIPPIIKPRGESEEETTPPEKMMYATLPTVPRLSERLRPTVDEKRKRRERKTVFWSERVKTELKRVMFARSGKRHA